MVITKKTNLKSSRPIVSAGFASLDSINCGSKTVFLIYSWEFTRYLGSNPKDTEKLLYTENENSSLEKEEMQKKTNELLSSQLKQLSNQENTRHRRQIIKWQKSFLISNHLKSNILNLLVKRQTDTMDF